MPIDILDFRIWRKLPLHSGKRREWKTRDQHAQAQPEEA